MTSAPGRALEIAEGCCDPSDTVTQGAATAGDCRLPAPSTNAKRSNLP